MKSDSNPYLEQVYRNLPRLLSLYNRDNTNPTYGQGDRNFWSWKLIDFPNGTFQGAFNGLSLLIAHNLLPDWFSEKAALHRINMMFCGAKTMTSCHGSLDEALPNEGSFCVTALVAVDALMVLRTLKSRLNDTTRTTYLDSIRPWISFLHRQDEHHGVISNHLCVAVLALVLWQDETGEASDGRARDILNCILDHQSDEGWFLEYEGADPGYQSWLMGAMAEIHYLRPNWELSHPLKKALDFLQYFIHPDHSYGGTYGARTTRFCFPAGYEKLSKEFPVSQAMTYKIRQGIQDHQLVTLDAIDAHNMIPLFNDYVHAAVLFGQQSQESDDIPVLPAFGTLTRRYFQDAGLLIDRGKSYYTVISLHKGGVVSHFVNHQRVFDNPGFIGKDDQGLYYTTQYFDNTNSIKVNQNQITLLSKLRPVKREFTSPFRFIILRILSLTVFRSLRLGNMVKRILAALLITKKPPSRGHVKRVITLGENIQIEDKQETTLKIKPVTTIPFNAIHMASHGYWQKSDDAL